MVSLFPFSFKREGEHTCPPGEIQRILWRSLCRRGLGLGRIGTGSLLCRRGEGVLGIIQVAQAGVFHPVDGRLLAGLRLLGNRRVELRHAIIEMVEIDRQQGAAPGIGRSAMGGDPFGVEPRVAVQCPRLGGPQADTHPDVLLDCECLRRPGRDAAVGPVAVGGGFRSRGSCFRDERDVFLLRGTGRLAGQRDDGGSLVRTARRRGSGRYGGWAGRGSGVRGLRKGQDGSECGGCRGKEEDEKAFHRYECKTILKRFILKSESRWKLAGIPEKTSPWEAARRLAHLPGLVFLDSALARKGAVSAIAACPEEIIEGETPRDWERLRAAVRLREGSPGMAAGYVEYGGRFRFGLYGRVLTFLHDEARWMDEGGLEKLMAEPAPMNDEAISFRPEMAGQDYEAMVLRAQEYIAAGDIYQVNLAHRFSAAWSGKIEQALGFYARLRACSPAPYAALMCTGDRVIASSSPELFLQIEGRDALTRPIKGTRARGSDAAADAAAARGLEASAKERAELVMITDLERNDLGQVCDYGSVEARELLKLERYAQVHHLVSTVAGRLRAGIDHIDALRACFPGGSITGAPKKRAREIIAELEPAERGLYTGTIGCMRYDGRSTFNIAIRTAVFEAGGEAYFHAGAGIVADSQPRKEWEETLWKAAGLLRAAQAPS